MAKAVSYRVFALFFTSLVALVFSGRIDVAAGIGITDAAIKIFLFYLHERAWCRLKYGLPKEPDYQI